MTKELEDYSNEVIRLHKQLKRVYTVVPYTTKHGLRLQYINNKNQDVYLPKKRLGYYVIYDSYSAVCNAPVYVGKGVVSNRIYRFFKELRGKSRKDEYHAAAKKYAKTYPSTGDEFTVSVVWRDEIKMKVSNFVLEYADERVAQKLNSRFNTMVLE